MFLTTICAVLIGITSAIQGVEAGVLEPKATSSCLTGFLAGILGPYSTVPAVLSYCSSRFPVPPATTTATTTSTFIVNVGPTITSTTTVFGTTTSLPSGIETDYTTTISTILTTSTSTSSVYPSHLQKRQVAATTTANNPLSSFASVVQGAIGSVCSCFEGTKTITTTVTSTLTITTTTVGTTTGTFTDTFTFTPSITTTLLISTTESTTRTLSGPTTTVTVTNSGCTNYFTCGNFDGTQCGESAESQDTLCVCYKRVNDLGGYCHTATSCDTPTCQSDADCNGGICVSSQDCCGSQHCLPYEDPFCASIISPARIFARGQMRSIYNEVLGKWISRREVLPEDLGCNSARTCSEVGEMKKREEPRSPVGRRVKFM